MEIGIDSFAAQFIDPETGITQDSSARVRDLLEEIVCADQVGVDSFGIGEHHRAENLDAAPTLLLAAAAARTKNIRLTSAVTVLSADDPVRVFQQFATLDLISGGRAEIVAGRGSSTDAYPLFGYDLRDYDSLYAEKLELLLALRQQTHIHWSGRYRAPLTGQGVFPRPVQNPLPVWVGVGGTPQSFVRAGVLGLPLMVAIIGGDFRRFRPLIDLYRAAGAQAGFAPEQLRVGIHAFGFVGKTGRQARDDFYPGYAHLVSTLGKARGWSPPSRPEFDAACGVGGPYLIGDPDEVAAKMLYVHSVLGGISRMCLQMTNVMMPPQKMLSSIELLGSRVAPMVRSSLG